MKFAQKPDFTAVSVLALVLAAGCSSKREPGVDAAVVPVVDALMVNEAGQATGADVLIADAPSDVVNIPLPPECEPPKLRLNRIAKAREPLALAQPAGDARLYVAERAGLVRIIKDGQLLAQPFLDMRPSIAFFAGMGMGQGERGLMSLAFHPNYGANGRFYVFYTRSVTDPNFEGVRREGDVVVAEGRRSAADPEQAAPTLKQLIVVQHDGVDGRNGCCDDAHNGGFVALGPDGHLYTGVGDGGGGANEYGNQVEGFSTLLRINVDAPSVPLPGGLGTQGVLAYSFAKGVRNPWRGSFDSKTGDLYFGDVGEDTWEEINYLPASQLNALGLDFGWGNPGMEGTRVVTYYPYVETGAPAYGVLPVHEYEHPIVDPERPRRGRLARAVVGGAVYRGTAIERMGGRYFFGDYATNTVSSLLMIEGRAYCVVDHTADLVSTQTPIQGLTGFGQGNNGELYIFDIFGNIYLIEKAL